MTYLGETSVDKYYLGDTEVDKIYLGDTEVYNKLGLLMIITSISQPTFEGVPVDETLTIVDNGDGTFTVSSYDVSTFRLDENKGDITKIEMLATGSLTDCRGMFSGCNNMVDFIAKSDSFRNVTRFQDGWRYNVRLSSFPVIDTSKGTDFNGAWVRCENLTSFPILDVSNGTDFTYTWSTCKAMKSFPSLDTSSGLSFNSTWISCEQLECIGEVDTTNATTTSNIFTNCTSLVNPTASEQTQIEGGYHYINENPCPQ